MFSIFLARTMSLVVDENFVAVLDYLCIVVEVNSNLRI